MACQSSRCVFGAIEELHVLFEHVRDNVFATFVIDDLDK